jgi:sulfhydrogenase subunit beta (sulfur reductase)
VAFVALDTKDMKRFLAAVGKQARVRGPVADASGVVLSDITPKSDIALSYANFKLPFKREFFPQCEVISRFDGSAVKEERPDNVPTVYFGVRPCDTQSIAFLDKVFLDEKYADPYYRNRRDNAVIVSLACNEPAATCFCVSTGGGPSSKSGADVIAYSLRQAMLFEPVTKKGEAFIKKYAKLFRSPSPKEVQEQQKLGSGKNKRMQTVAVSGVPSVLEKKSEASFWDRIAETCLGCGACTFLCPTCHCFDLCDEKKENGFSRLRLHDACMFASFVREASGHNPRNKKGERMRQRVMHKFSYAPEIYQTVFCVGCGRCVAACPSNIDIRETIAEVTA